MAANRARVVRSAPASVVTTGHGSSFRQIAGSMGAAQISPAVPEAMDTAFEPGGGELGPADIRAREAAAGIVPTVDDPQPQRWGAETSNLQPGKLTWVADPRGAAGLSVLSVTSQPADLSPLPDRFALEIERKPDGMWKITAPGVHIGLFVADADLSAGLAQAPAVLARIVRLDGIVAKPRRRGKT